MAWRRYVAIGDSTSEGLDDPDGRGGFRGWADRLAGHLAAAQGTVEYANLAVRGRTTRQIRDEQLEAALALEPDLATVVAGMNDLLRPRFDAGVLAGDLEAMQRSLRRSGSTVVTFTLPDLGRVMPVGRLLRRRVVALNAAIRAATERSGALLLDLAGHCVAEDPRLWSDDRLHANALGHERIAAALAHRLGLPGSDDSWTRPLPPPRPVRSHELVAAEWAWLHGHLGPWVLRHLRGHSSGDGRTAKQPVPTTVRPATTAVRSPSQGSHGS
jgi:lysophospholipase L1-like esterase